MKNKKVESLVKNLNNFLEKSNKTYHINQGGCGLVAVLIGEQLFNRKINFSLKYSAPFLMSKITDDDDICNTNTSLKPEYLSTHYVSFSHVWVGINHMDINACQVIPDRVISNKEYIVTIFDNIVNGLNSDVPLWNSSYDTKNNIKIINKIKKIFDKFDE